MTNHTFNILLAEKAGINAAVIYQHLSYWIDRNLAEQRVDEDGRAWVSCTVNGLNKTFPYLTERQISIAITRLTELGFLKKSYKSKNKFHRELSYSFGENRIITEFTSASNGYNTDVESDFTSASNEISRQRKMLLMNSNNKSNNKSIYRHRLKSLCVPDYLIDDFMLVRKKKKAVDSETAWNGFVREVDKAGLTIQQAVTICIERDWKGFKAEWIANDKQHGKEDFFQMAKRIDSEINQNAGRLTND